MRPEDYQGMSDFLAEGVVARPWLSGLRAVGSLSVNQGLRVYQRNHVGSYLEGIRRACPDFAAQLSESELGELARLLSQRVPRKDLSTREFDRDLEEACRGVVESPIDPRRNEP